MEIQLSDLFKAIRNRLWLILTITVVSVAATGWCSFYVLTPKYQATTTLLVQNSTRFNYDNMVAYEKLASAIVKSKTTAAHVIWRLDLKTTEEELLKNVKVTGVKGSMITKISVTHPDPQQAIVIANSFAEAFKETLPEMMDVGNIVTLDQPQLDKNGKPVIPNPIFNMVIVLILVSNITIGLVIVLEVLDKTVKTEKVLQKVLDLPVLATIPMYRSKKRKILANPDFVEEQGSYLSESFRKLRTNILYRQGQAIQTLVISSALPGEGKTLTAVNLAMALAQDGKNVLLVDGNLRNSSLHRLFNVSNEKGLTSYLSNVDLQPAILPTDQENLHMLPSGPSVNNPSEILATKEMVELLNKFKNRYDLILLDSPPVIPVTDTQVLSINCDAVLLVTKLGTTLCESVSQAKELLSHVGANLVGTVGNCQRVRYKNIYHSSANASSKTDISLALYSKQTAS